MNYILSAKTNSGGSYVLPIKGLKSLNAVLEQIIWNSEKYPDSPASLDLRSIVINTDGQGLTDGTAYPLTDEAIDKLMGET